jgi:hypothetical protein
MEFREFPKISRFSREMVITEKIDGTNGVIVIGEQGEFVVGSRHRFITPDDDNMGFAKWAYAHKDELFGLGVGYHYGEWWGQGIQRGYGLKEKRFSLFNIGRWYDATIRPECCGVVPILYSGKFSTETVKCILSDLERVGSQAAPGFMNPEGVVIFHTASRTLWKKTIKNDEYHKGEK